MLFKGVGKFWEGRDEMNRHSTDTQNDTNLLWLFLFHGSHWSDGSPHSSLWNEITGKQMKWCYYCFYDSDMLPR